MHQEIDSELDKVIIEIENNKFYCNRTKLSKYSDYFNVMFNGDFAEKDKNFVIIKDVPENGFKNCLDLIDKKLEFLEYEQLLETLHCACVLQFDDIKLECIKRLNNDLRLDYCLDIWNTTEFLDIHPLCERAKCCAMVEFPTIADKHKASISQISIKQLHSYLANQLICCDNELDIFQAGMNWWYDNSKLQGTENWSKKDTNKYLYTILSCVYFKNLTVSSINHMLTFPDIKDNDEIRNILLGIISLIEDPTSKINEKYEDKVKNLFFNTKPRTRYLLPCIITSELPWDPEQNKRTKPMEPEVNISYYARGLVLQEKCIMVFQKLTLGTHFKYPGERFAVFPGKKDDLLSCSTKDSKSRSIEHIFTNETTFFTKCSRSLNGCKILPYKQNILLFGGEYSYGSANWNNNVWLYHTFTNEWTLLTKMPKERRHFNACIANDKLFVIGGTGKYRVRANNEMMMYDIIEDKWCELISLPYSWYDIQICEYQNQLFVIPAVHDNKFAYIFDCKTLGWIKLTIKFPPNFIFEFTKTFVLFSKGDMIYAKGLHFLEMQVDGPDLKVKSFLPQKELHGDKINSVLINDKLYIFSQHGTVDSDAGSIYQLHCFNLITKKTDLLIQINDNVDQKWHIRRGCFPFFHYNITRDLKCISDFVL